MRDFGKEAHYEKFNYKHFSLYNNLITYISLTTNSQRCRFYVPRAFTGLSFSLTHSHCGKYKCIMFRFSRMNIDGGGGDEGKKL